MHMDQHMMDGNNQMMPQDGMGPNNGQHMYQNCQNQMMPQGQPGQMPQGGQPMVMCLNHLWNKVHHRLLKINSIFIDYFLSQHF